MICDDKEYMAQKLVDLLCASHTQTEMAFMLLEARKLAEGLRDEKHRCVVHASLGSGCVTVFREPLPWEVEK